MPSNSVVVGLRIRPLNSIERAENSRAVFRVRGDNTVVEEARRRRSRSAVRAA